jgi:Uncharacterized protein conserved in bacteria (DUF2252)
MTHFQTPQERRALGRARRKQLARQEHSQWKPESRRRGPVELLQESMRGRIPQLVTLKYERMLESPFGYFRGAVPVMAADLGTLPNTGIVNQICGDAHVRNLGAYAAPDGRLVFDINDFDETIAGPFEWDLKRLSTSLVLCGSALAAKKSACQAAVLAFIERYKRFVDTFARMPVTEIARYQVHRLQRISPVSKALLKAERSTPLHSLEQQANLQGPKAPPDPCDRRPASGCAFFACRIQPDPAARAPSLSRAVQSHRRSFQGRRNGLGRPTRLRDLFRGQWPGRSVIFAD